tara:strand:+ start:1417 stop:1596 length:180 start_codon:yes stop_codon:yes gene_type:complete
MPYQIKKVGKSYKLYNLSKKKFVNINYKSKASAMSAGKNFMRYRGEKKVKVVGNKLLHG